MTQIQATHNKKHYTGGDVVFSIINYAIFGLFTLICVYPFYYLIINTISANTNAQLIRQW